MRTIADNCGQLTVCNWLYANLYTCTILLWDTYNTVYILGYFITDLPSISWKVLEFVLLFIIVKPYLIASSSVCFNVSVHVKQAGLIMKAWKLETAMVKTRNNDKSKQQTQRNLDCGKWYYIEFSPSLFRFFTIIHRCFSVRLCGDGPIAEQSLM